jgi:hypothetical protein
MAGRLRGRRAALGSIAGFVLVTAGYVTLVLLQRVPGRFF